MSFTKAARHGYDPSQSLFTQDEEVLPLSRFDTSLYTKQTITLQFLMKRHTVCYELNTATKFLCQNW